MAPNTETTIEKLLSIYKEDPNAEFSDGKEYPKELLYTLRLVDWLKRLEPSPSKELLIAAHGQHLYRWRIPRKEYPMDKKGYYQWRNALKEIHAEETGHILKESGYQGSFISRVQQIIKKENLKTDEEVMVLEDAINLSFIQNYLEQFNTDIADSEKMKGIIIKVWNKMTPKAHEMALGIELKPELKAALVKILEEL